MSTLGIDLSDREKVIGWEAIRPTHRRTIRTAVGLEQQVWALRDRLIEQGLEEGRFDYEPIQALAALAADLHRLEIGGIDPCHCVVPEQGCPACTLLARTSYILQHQGV